MVQPTILKPGEGLAVMPDKADKPDPDELVTIKIRRHAHRLAKAVAAWRDVSTADYISDAIMRSVETDLASMGKDIKDLLGGKRNKE